jgi:hypothetical protein
MFWSRSSKNLNEPSTTSLINVYNTQFQAKMKKLWLLKMKGGLDVLKQMDKTYTIVYTLWTNISNLMEGHVPPINNRILKKKSIFFVLFKFLQNL